MSKNYFKMQIEDNLCLVYPEIRMAKELFELIDSDRKHLRQFLDFVDGTIDYTNQEDYFKMKLEGISKQTDALFFIAVDDKLIGCADFHGINLTNRQAEIGYWIHSKYKNQGITSKVVKKLCEYAFESLELNRLTIVADIENVPSNKVALKNGFTLVGTQKEERLMYDKLRDMNHYYLLKRDFLNNQ
ncbi:GNAT family N-acetyltransferase [Enterococcus crotali]|uniref:GNAT family N-acetyltransferase n=1 Tax=Enterococcus crotali TaxID=1453587 RepID=UPI00046EB76D|nr:GNAT family protein [Enterococcus crotali]